MREEIFQLTVLGARGSMAVEGPDFDEFGGATSCYLVQAGEETLFLDGGSGLVGAPTEFPRDPVILLSHLHLDHLLGLGMYPRLVRKGAGTQIYVPVPEGEDANGLLNRLYSPPFWPLALSGYAGNVSVKPLRLPLSLGDVLVEGMPGSHPDGCVILKVSFRGKSLVYMTDYEHSGRRESATEAFVRGADLLLFDGQYTESEYPGKKGFGHSTAGEGIRLMEACGVKRLLIIHHDPGSTDAELSRREAALSRSDVRYARRGDVIRI